MLPPFDAEVLFGFAIGSSGPRVVAFATAVTGLLRRWYRARWLACVLYIALAVLWISAGLPSTQSSTGGNYGGRMGILWGLLGGALVGTGWMFWQAASSTPPRDRRGFEVEIRK